jgi:hypothetical protein
MKEHIIEIVEMLLLAGVAAILAVVIKAKKETLLALVQSYIKRAEVAVQGSGMGAEKKKLVISWLEASGIKITDYLSKAIDNIVKHLNDTQAWAIDKEKSRND